MHAIAKPSPGGPLQRMPRVELTVGFGPDDPEHGLLPATLQTVAFCALPTFTISRAKYDFDPTHAATTSTKNYGYPRRSRKVPASANEGKVPEKLIWYGKSRRRFRKG